MGELFLILTLVLGGWLIYLMPSHDPLKEVNRALKAQKIKGGVKHFSVNFMKTNQFKDKLK